MSALESDWPDPDQRDDALWRALARTHAQPVPQLTAMEVRVLEALAHGAGVRGAADITGLTESAAASHIRRARSILGAKDRTHAVAIALRLRLIT